VIYRHMWALKESKALLAREQRERKQNSAQEEHSMVVDNILVLQCIMLLIQILHFTFYFFSG